MVALSARVVDTKVLKATAYSRRRSTYAAGQTLFEIRMIRSKVLAVRMITEVILQSSHLINWFVNRFNMLQTFLKTHFASKNMRGKEISGPEFIVYFCFLGIASVFSLGEHQALSAIGLIEYGFSFKSVSTLFDFIIGAARTSIRGVAEN